MGRGSRLSLVITDVDLEASRGCHFDYVALYEGLRPVSRRSLGKFCGGEEVSARTIQSQGHAITIRYHISDDDVMLKWANVNLDSGRMAATRAGASSFTTPPSATQR